MASLETYVLVGHRAIVFYRFWKPLLVPLGLVEQEQAMSKCFLEQNRVALREIFAWCVPF